MLLITNKDNNSLSPIYPLPLVSVRVWERSGERNKGDRTYLQKTKPTTRLDQMKSRGDREHLRNRVQTATISHEN